MTISRARPPGPPDNAPMQLQVSRFEGLGDAFHTRLPATPLPSPHWVGWSAEAAALLGLAPELVRACADLGYVICAVYS